MVPLPKRQRTTTSVSSASDCSDNSWDDVLDTAMDLEPPQSPPEVDKGQIQANVKTHNSYQPLADEGIVNRATSSQNKNQNKNNNNDKTNSGPKPPPIFIYTNNTMETINIASNCCKNKYKLKPNSDHIIAQTSHVDDFRLLISSLKARKIEHFTYDLKADRPAKIIIKHMPIDISISSIEEDLKNQELPFISVQFLQGKSEINNLKARTKIPVLLLHVPRSELNKYYKNLETLVTVTVTVEPYKKRFLTQCYNCQRFNHSSNCCNLAAKCVKCGQKHASKECDKPTSTAAKCANCGNEHTANYRGCPTYQKVWQTRKPVYTHPSNAQIRSSKATPNGNTNENLYNSSPNKPAPNVSNMKEFPELPNRRTPNTQAESRTPDAPPTTNTPTANDNPTQGNPLKEILDFLKQFNLSKIITTIRDISTKLKNTNDNFEKILIIVEAAGTLLN